MYLRLFSDKSRCARGDLQSTPLQPRYFYTSRVMCGSRLSFPVFLLRPRANQWSFPTTTTSYTTTLRNLNTAVKFQEFFLLAPAPCQGPDRILNGHPQRALRRLSVTYSRFLTLDFLTIPTKRFCSPIAHRSFEAKQT